MTATANNNGNLVLLRRVGETVVIGSGRNRVELTVEKITRDKIVALKFNASKAIAINRLERPEK